ncbi:MAG TPA: hypothetical protein VGF24_34525 [Vicinamibacterales bacterium]|jgi:hypothetical protein
MTTHRRNLAAPIGLLAIALGIALSGRFLEWTIFPAGTIVGTDRREPLLLLCRIAIVFVGLYMVVRRPRLTTVHLVVAAIGIAVGAFAGALLLQVAYVPPPITSGWKAFAPAKEWNQLGYRGHPISYVDDDYTVLLLGDSQVEAMAIPYDDMPERRLESYLATTGEKVRVFSIGAGGYGQDQELLALERYLAKYRADLVVLWQTPGNDIWNNLFKTHMSGNNPKPTYWLDDAGHLAGPNEGLGQPLANSPIVAGAIWQRVFGLPWQDKRWERRLPQPYTPLDKADGPIHREWQERWDKNIGRMRDENLDTEKSHLAVGLRPRSPRMQYALDLTRALTRRLQELVASHGGKLVTFQVDTDDSIPKADGIYLLNGKYYRVSKDQYEANWAYVNAGFDTELVRTTVKDWRVGPEDGHLNARADDQVMRDLSERLKPRIAAARSAHSRMRKGDSE